MPPFKDFSTFSWQLPKILKQENFQLIYSFCIDSSKQVQTEHLLTLSSVLNEENLMINYFT